MVNEKGVALFGDRLLSELGDKIYIKKNYHREKQEKYAQKDKKKVENHEKIKELIGQMDDFR